MCGIAGFVGGRCWAGQDVGAILGRMGRSLLHRGPDHSDLWIDSDGQVAISHNRLAIVDVSPAGHQPMRSKSGRFVIVYNGEIYNHREIRAELISVGAEPCWKSHSDTETLLAAIEQWGVRGALERSTGMFAFALWDRAKKTLTLARDRLGEKPLYFGRQAGAGAPFFFASELKAIAQHPEFRREIDHDAVALLLRYNNIPAPFSIYRGIAKLLPGTILTLRAGSSEAETNDYWSGAAVAEAGVANPSLMSDKDAIDGLENILETAISNQMIADVPT